jgi:hypothetical protein
VSSFIQVKWKPTLTSQKKIQIIKTNENKNKNKNKTNKQTKTKTKRQKTNKTIL